MNDHTGAPAAGLNPLRGAWAFARANSLPMVSGALLGLLWANVDLDGYERFTHALHFAVNDIAMVFFFGLAVKEIIEATAPGGALHSFDASPCP